MSQDQPNHTGHVLADRYEIIDEIGRGGFGMVYRARQVNMDREVAVKVLPPQFMAIEDVVARFKREAHLSSRLKHPNTITIHDYGQANNLLFIVMELLDGEDLADILKKERTLEQQRILHIARQVLKSLAEAHEQGIVHRDLKPENIYLTRVGEDTDFVKVLDFGIAKLAEPGGGEISGRRLTVTGSTVGTPVYMSPEQAAGEEVDHLTDLYALGIIMYEMATGHPPFNDKNPVKIMRAHLFTEVPPFPDDCALAGTSLERVVMQALHKDKPLRIQSAGEFLRALDASEPQITALPASLFSLGPQSDKLVKNEPHEEPPTLEWFDDPPSEDSIEISREDTSTFDRITRRHDTSENEIIPNTNPDRLSDAVPFGAFPSKQPPREPVRESALNKSNEISALSMLADQQVSLSSALVPGGREEDEHQSAFHDLPPPALNQRELGSVSSIITVVELPPSDDEVILLTQPKIPPANLDLGRGGQAPAGNVFILGDEPGAPETPAAGVSGLTGFAHEYSSSEEITPGQVPPSARSGPLPPKPHYGHDTAPNSGEILLPKQAASSNEIIAQAPPEEDPSAEWSWDPNRSKALVRDVESGAFPQLQDKKKRELEKKREKQSGISLGVVIFFLFCLLVGAFGALVFLDVIKLP